MRTSTTVAAYAAGLVAVFGAAYGVGAATGNPTEPPAVPHISETHEGGHR